jgi:hypothetical protein
MSNQAIDEMLVGLGEIVLRLSSPNITRTAEEHAALARSVNQFSICATGSDDSRVQALAEKLQAKLGRPTLRLVSSRA